MSSSRQQPDAAQEEAVRRDDLGVELEQGLPLLTAHTSKRLSKKDQPWVACAGPGCTRTISPEAAAKVKYCGICQLREREVRMEAAEIELTPEGLAFLWENRTTFRVSEAAKFLGLKTRTLYALVSKDRVRAQRNADGCLVVRRADLIEYGRHLKGMVGLKEAAEMIDVDYGYLRELVRRQVIVAERTFWGHYGLRTSKLDQVKADLVKALPGSRDYNLVSFSESLGVHHSLVQKWIRQGKISSYKGLTGRITIPHAELDRFTKLVRERQRFLPQKVRARILEHLEAGPVEERNQNDQRAG